MATITYTDNGEQRTVPMWATEATLMKLLDAMKGGGVGGGGGSGSPEKDAKTLKELLGSIKDLNDGFEEMAEDVEEGGKKVKEAAEDIEDGMDKLGFSFERLIGGGMAKLGGAIDFLVGGSLLILSTAFAALSAKIIQTGNNFATLSQSGLALEGTTALNIAQFNQLGMSTADAVEAMTNNSQIMRVMGQSVVPQVVDEFLTLTNQGQDLGLALGDATDLALDELTMRSRLMNLGALDEQQRKVAINRIQEVNRNQLKYSKALGVSTDVLRDFADQVLGGNEMLMASLITTTNVTRAETIAGLSDFVSGLRAMGGEAGGEIAAAVVEAASMGAVGFSDAAFGFITVLPQLSDNFQGVIDDFNNGLIDGEGAAMAITQELGNLGQAEKDRVFLLARAGDEQAKKMAAAITQFEQSADKMRDQGVEIEGVQRGMQAFNAVISKVRGLFSSVFNQFIQGFGEGAGDLADYMSKISNAFMPIVYQLTGLEAGVGDTSKSFIELGKKFAVGLTEKISAFANWIAGMIEWLQGYFNNLQATDFKGKVMEVLGDIGGVMMEGFKKMIEGPVKDAIIFAFGLAIAAGVAKGLASKGAAALFGGGGGGGGGGIPGGAGKKMMGMGRGMKGLAVGMRAFANPMVIAGVAVVTAAIMGIGFALKLAAPGIEAFGLAIKSVFEGIGAIVESVGVAIAKVVEAVGKNKVAKINARAEAMVKTTKATTEAIKELAHLDPTHVMGMAEGIDMLGESLGTFTANMTPGYLQSMKGAFANFLGQESPIQAVMTLSKEADPVKIMDLAKATIAANAASAGATEMPDLAGPDGGTTNNTTNNTYAGGGGGGTGESNQAFIDIIMEQSAIQVNALAEMKKQNRLLTEISGKTG